MTISPWKSYGIDKGSNPPTNLVTGRRDAM